MQLCIKPRTIFTPFHSFVPLYQGTLTRCTDVLKDAPRLAVKTATPREPLKFLTATASASTTPTTLARGESASLGIDTAIVLHCAKGILAFVRS